MTVGAGFVVGVAASTHIARYCNPGFQPVPYRPIVRRCFSDSVAATSVLVSFLLLILNAFGYVFFSWATAYTDTAVVSSLFELWPIAWILFFRYIDRRRHGISEYSIVPLTTIVLMVLGAGAIALIIYSTASPAGSGHGVSLPLLGIILGVVAPLVGALGAFSFLFTDRVLYGKTHGSADNWDILTTSRSQTKNIEESLVHAGIVMGRMCAIPVVILLAAIESGLQSALLSRSFAGGLLCGLVLNGPGGILLRRAHLVTSRREIVSLQYLSPVLALVWLAILTEIEVARIDFLIFGTVSIVALNMLINADPEKKRSSESADSRARVRLEGGAIQERYSLKALVVSLLGFGMLVFYRDDIMSGQDLSWRDDGSYWAVLGLSSTVFALLLAFRLTRVESLLLAEDYRTLGILRRVENLPSKIFDKSTYEDSKVALLGYVRLLNRANSLDEYRDSYDRANAILQRISVGLSNRDLQLSHEETHELSDIRTELDALAHGRQQAREFAERIALWLIGIMVVVFCLAVPSEGSGWARLLSETFAVMLSSVVVYLLFHLADMRRSRADELVMAKGRSESSELPDGLYIRFRDEKDAQWQRIFAGLIIFGVVLTVVGLLAWSRLITA